MATLNLPEPTSSDYSTWATVTRATLSLIKDPMKLVARVMMAMTNAQASLLTTMTTKVTALTDRMADVNELMQMVNNGLAALKTKEEDDLYTLVKAGSSPTAAEIKARLIAAGVQAPGLNIDSSGNLIVSKKNLSAANQNMQLTVDTISSTTQQAQLSLQTLMGRYNGTFEVVTSAIKKNETQAEAININIKK